MVGVTRRSKSQTVPTQTDKRTGVLRCDFYQGAPWWMSAANINAAFKSCVALGNKSWLDVNWGVEGCDASNPNWIRVNDDDDGRARLWILAISIKVKIGKEKSEWMMASCAPCNEQPPTDDHQTAVCSTFIFVGFHLIRYSQWSGAPWATLSFGGFRVL